MARPAVPAARSPTQASPARAEEVKLRFSDVSVSKLVSDGKYFVEVSVDQTKQKTGTAKGKSDVRWPTELVLNAQTTGTVRLDLHRTRLLGSSKRAASLQLDVQHLYDLWQAKGGPTRVSKSLDDRSTLEFHLHVETCTASARNIISSPDPSPQEILRQRSRPSEVSTPSVHVERLQRAKTVASNMATTTKTIASTGEAFMQFMDRFKVFVDIVDQVAEVHPYTRMAWGVISAVPKLLTAQMEQDKDMCQLFDSLFAFYDIVDDLSVETVDALKERSDILSRIVHQTLECHYFIQEYYKTEGFVKRALKNIVSTVQDQVADFQHNLAELKSEFYGRVATSTHVTVARILDKVGDLDEEYNLDDLSYTRGARFDTDKVCLKGTREEILEDITTWIQSDTGRLLWITGNAGTGKSAIAHTIAARFSFLQRLGSSFFFVRGQAGHDPENLFSTFARNLADLDDTFRQTLATAIRRDRALRTTNKVSVQFENFLAKPCQHFSMPGPVVFVIDGLDECGDRKSRKALLDVLSSRLKDLPSNFRLIVTSRAEEDIETSFCKSSYVEIRRMADISTVSTKRDIHTFLAKRLEDLEVDLDVLTQKSELIFQWAFVAAEYIAEDQPGSSWEERYDTVLASGSIGDEGALYSLYRQVLGQLFLPNANAVALARFRLVMAVILTVLEPLSADSISALIPHLPLSSPLRSNIPKLFDPMIIIKFMGSLLSGVSSRSKPVHMLHASFKDFLTSPKDGQRFFVDLSSANRDLAIASLALLKQELRFNICDLPSSYLPNDRIVELPALIQQHIPAYLSYASLYWSSHLEDTPPDAAVYEGVLDFLNSKLLFWLEAISLLNAVKTLPGVIMIVLRWAQDTSSEKQDSLSEIMSDLQLYLPIYGAVLARSAPHVYMSLPFLPERSAIANLYLPRMRRTLCLASKRSAEWPLVHGVFTGHEAAVLSVAVSPDSARIASCGEDGTIRYWDVATGTLVSDPVHGHGGEPVNKVAFSPNGHLIASAGNDGTVRLWDTTKFEQVGEPLVGHVGVVTSLAFSPNGRFLASGGYDETVIVWSVSTREQVYAPLRAHTMAVSCVAFSADSSYLVSGSYDCTVAFYFTSSGLPMRDPLRAHNMPISCIALSSDGLQMMTSSYDDKIWLWDTTHWARVGCPSYVGSLNDFAWVAEFSHDGKHIAFNSYHEAFSISDASTCCMVGGPQRGHDSSVLSIAFFRDGKRIATGSLDSTIRLWNMPDPSAKPISTGSSAHTESVNAVAWSPTGEYVVTGSHDNTVRLWNVSTGKQVGQPRKGHTKTVMAVAFSPDGQLIASGAYDSTVRIFSVNGSSSTSQVFRGHSGSVNSVAFDATSQKLVSGSDDSTVRIWSVATGKPLMPPLRGHAKPITSVKLAQAAKLIASGGHDCTVRLWSLETGACAGEVLRGPDAPIHALSILTDGKLLVTGHSDGSIVVWDVESRQMVGKPVAAHHMGVVAVALSPDGERTVSSAWDRSVRMTGIDLQGGEHTPGHFLSGHDHNVFSIAYCPKGRTVATASYDRTVRLWDTTIVARRMPGFSLCSDGPLSPSASVTFSFNPEHALADPDPLFPPSTDASDRRDGVRLTEDGWLVGPDDALLLWIPHEYRVGVWTPRTTGLLGTSPTLLDLSSFAHGTRWAECWVS